ncbi:hypothetical protein Tco_0106484 [Tanacetum coccineum]
MPMLLTTKGALGQVRKLHALNAEPREISRVGVQSRRTTIVVIKVEMAMLQQKCTRTTLSSIVPRRYETLIIHGEGSNLGSETRLNIISCTKTQKYLLKGYHVFLAHITMNQTEDKSGEKRLEDVPIVRDFSKVFPKDLPGLPPTRQVEFQIDLMPGVAPVA